MVWGGVSAESRTNLICLQGLKINSQTYQELILDKEISGAGQNLLGTRSWTFQQDSAPAHASKISQSWFLTRNIDFISKNELPPSSPDLNPMDYSVWYNLEARDVPSHIIV